MYSSEQVSWQFFSIYFVFFFFFILNLFDKTFWFSDVLRWYIKREVAITLYKKWSFPLRISSVNVTKSAISFGFLWIWWHLLKKYLLENFIFLQSEWGKRNSESCSYFPLSCCFLGLLRKCTHILWKLPI